MPSEDQLRAQVEQRHREALAVELAALRADAERARWCEENRADVEYGCYTGGVYVHEWFVQWDGVGTVHTVRHADRNAAIDLARGA